MSFITSFIHQMMVNATIYTLAALGIVIAGRTGIFNVAGEGIMLVSASAGFISSYLTGNWLFGFFIGALAGCIFGFLLVFIHETFKISQFIIGITLYIVGSGLSDLLYKVIIGIQLSAPLAPAVPLVSIPLLTELPILSGLFRHDAIVYFMYLSIFVTWWFFYRTKLGLETRAIGENPKALDVVGVNIVARRYIATMVGSAIMGISGAYFPIVMTKTYCPNISGGRGFMAIGIAIFASWKPQRVILGGILFAMIEVISYQFQLMSKGIPYQAFLMLPFLSVIVIMMVFKKKTEYPAALGEPYNRE